MACKLKQIVCIDAPVRSSEFCVIEDTGTAMEYEVSYSTDRVNWSDWMSYPESLEYTTVLTDDYFVRLQVYGNPCEVTQDREPVPYSVSLAPSFDFSTTASSSAYDPYANLDCALKLYQQLSENVSNMIGLPCWYFKVTGDADSRDVTFKEYCHLNVTAVKYIKIIVNDGKMPSSRPQIDDYGINWETDWETEISKATFATAFGNTAQPLEGDLVYIPMMKRMWQVNSAYEEKNEGFMWNATTFTVFLRKYEAREDISTGNFEEAINSVVKNTYEDLFGETVTGTNEETFSAPVIAEPKSNVYRVYEQDAYRKEISLDTLSIKEDPLYHKGVLVADNWYTGTGVVTYQKPYCGTDGTVSFYIQNYGGSGTVLKWGYHEIVKSGNDISWAGATLTLDAGTYLVWFRWSASMRRVEAGAVPVALPDGIPENKIRPSSYFLDFSKKIPAARLYTLEDGTADKSEIVFSGTGEDMYGSIKFFSAFEDLQYLVQQYPNASTLVFNDTVRKIVDVPGYPVQNNPYRN